MMKEVFFRVAIRLGCLTSLVLWYSFPSRYWAILFIMLCILGVLIKQKPDRDSRIAWRFASIFICTLIDTLMTFLGVAIFFIRSPWVLVCLLSLYTLIFLEGRVRPNTDTERSQAKVLPHKS